MSLPGCLRLRDPRDRAALALLALPAAALVVASSPWLPALALWWTGNTVAHHAAHRRFFVGRRAEAGFRCALTLLLGVPQRLWQRLHLAHHAGRAFRWRGDAALRREAAVLAAAAATLACIAPGRLLAVHLPGVALGLLLAALHGRGEHARGTTDQRTRWWNVPMLNDGWHAEHHAAPGRHWRDLPDAPLPDARCSALPPPLRWLEALRPAAWLDAAERLVLRSPWLRARVLAAHRRALAHELAGLPAPARVLVVGGGLFPRSALLLRERFPRARITVVDGEPRHLALAAPLLPTGVETRAAWFTPALVRCGDLVVLPLALRGARAPLLANAAARVLVHEWAWRSPGTGCVVAWWLCKRVRLIEPAALVAPAVVA